MDYFQCMTFAMSRLQDWDYYFHTDNSNKTDNIFNFIIFSISDFTVRNLLYTERKIKLMMLLRDGVAIHTVKEIPKNETTSESDRDALQ